MDSIIKLKMKDVEQQFNDVSSSIDTKNAKIKELQKEVFDEESNAIYLRGKYEGLTEALEIVESTLDGLGELVTEPDTIKDEEEK